MNAGNDKTKPADSDVTRQFHQALEDWLNRSFHSTPVKQELIYGINRLIQQFPGLKETKLRLQAEGIIFSTIKSKYAVTLREEEIRQVWM